MLDSFLRQVTKDSYGPISFLEKTKTPVIIHKFHDAISVLGWGKMPDPILDRGRAAAVTYSVLNQKLLSTDAWKTFLRSAQALSFRKAGTSIQQSGNVSSMLNELAETFPMRSTFLGAIGESSFRDLDGKLGLWSDQLLKLEASSLQPVNGRLPMIYPVIEFIAEEKVPAATVMGRTVWDYSIFKNQAAPKALPFEFLCHFKLTESSLKNLKVDSISLPKTASLQTLQAGTSWDFPVIELVLPQDPFERRIGLSEAIWMTGFKPEFLQRTLLTAAWVAAFTRTQVVPFELQSVKLRFAIGSDGNLILNDCFALDDLHLEKEGQLYHSSTAIEHYQKTSWFEAVMHARNHGETFGMSEWKRLCVEPAPFLEAKTKSKLEAESLEIATLMLGK